MNLVGAVVLALALAAGVLVVVELVRRRSDPIVWAVLLLAIANALVELSRLS